MKKIFLFLMLCFMATAYTFAQNIDPTPLTLQGTNWDDTTIFTPRKQTKFVLGWQWAGPAKKVNQRLNITTYLQKFGTDVTRENIFPTIADTGDTPVELLWEQLDYPNHPTNTVWGFGGHSLQFDPTAPTAINYSAPNRIGDTTGAVLGFGYRNTTLGSLTNDTTNENFDRYMLHMDSTGLPSTSGITVLENPVIDDKYWQDHDIYPERNGQAWYVSINLRRMDTADVDSNSDTILTIQLPYKLVEDNDLFPKYITFDQIPVTTLDTIRLLNGRGLALKLRPQSDTGQKATKFVITRAMLPINAQASPLPRDITISAYFKFKRAMWNNDPNTKDTIGIQNPYLKGIHTDSADVAHDVNKIKLEVKYHGRSNVAIDWIRIEKPRTQKILRGGEDDWIRQCVEHNLQHIRNFNDSGHNVRLRSFYGVDEPGDDPWEWTIQRYYNRIFDYRFITEGTDDLTKAAIGYKTTWFGAMPHSAESGWGVPPTMPYIKHGTDWYNSLGFKRGMSEGDLPDAPYSQDGSSYETWVKLGSGTGTGPVRISSADVSHSLYKTNNYPAYLGPGSDGGPLATIEGSVNFLHTQKILYNGLPWWTNVLGYSQWNAVKEIYPEVNINGVDTVIYVDKGIRNHFKRPQTGEELRTQLWYTLLLGGKGLMYDRMYSDTWDSVNAAPSNSGISHYVGMMRNHDNSTFGSLSGDSIIKSIEAGSDFIEIGDPSHLDTYIHYTDVAINMGVAPNRLYIGRRSMRREVMKMHDRIQIFGDTLMRLQLAAWYGKGFSTIENNDGTRQIRQFLRVGNVPLDDPFNTALTKPIGRLKAEPWDSAFVDYTILRDTATATTDVFYTGVLNRRTNPLVRWPNGSGGDSLRFFTTAEFDSICTVTPSWKYKQGGSRTITLPFGVSNSTGYALLRVQELGGGIDTVVGQDKDLAVNFLPGEGKLFKVTVLKPDNTTAGFLNYSNQRKLVAVPINGNSDSVRYHLTYYKTIVKPVPPPPALPPPPRLGVYYQRSIPTTGQTNEENIVWENTPELISDFVTTANGNDTLDCAYPSLVVRYDSVASAMKTYIVYSCLKKGVTASLDNIMIAETQFLAERSRGGLLPPMGGQVIVDTVAGKLMANWGTPSINASSQGNYYTWSDSLRGIGIGYKTPGATTFSVTPKKYIYADAVVIGDAVHPSLNTYSRISWNENDCAVVWSEFGFIYYARPQFDALSNSIRLMTLSGGQNISANLLEVIQNNTIIKISNEECTVANTFPVVYRAIENLGLYTPGAAVHHRTQDRIAWEGRRFNENFYRRIFYQPLNFNDITLFPGAPKTITSWTSSIYRGIYSFRRLLGQPDLSQGSFYPIGTALNRSDSAVVLSFARASSSAPYANLSSTSGIWHIPLRLATMLPVSDNNSITSSSVRGIALKDVGQLAHLAARPELTNRNQFKQTRRVFEKGSGSPPSIISTAQHFYRTGINTEEQATVASGFSYQCLSRLMLNPSVDDVPLIFMSLDPIVDSTLQVTIPANDTIRTDWFTIGPSATLTTYFHGTDTSHVRLELIEKTTMAVVVTPIPLETSTDSTVQEIKYTFLNGGNAEYRLEFMRTDTNAQFAEDIIVGEVDIDSVGSPRAGAGSSNGHYIFDLTKKAVKGNSSTDGLYISSYPNPVQDAITITCSQDLESLEKNGRSFYAQNEITLTISDPVGRTIVTYTLSPGSSITVPTQNFPSGMYIIRAQGAIFGKASSTFVVQH